MSDVLQPENILIDLAVPTKVAVLQVLAARTARRLGLPEEAIYAALDHRERLGSTGIGEGIAVPHATVPGLPKVFTMMARLDRPVEFDAIDGERVDLVFVMLVPDQGKSDYLKMLATIARTLRSPGVLEAVRSATDVDRVYTALVSSDDSVS